MGTIVLAMIAVRILTAMVIVQVFVIVLLALIQQVYTVFRGEPRRPNARGRHEAHAAAPQSTPGPQVRRQPPESRRAGPRHKTMSTTAAPAENDDASATEALRAPGK